MAIVYFTHATQDGNLGTVGNYSTGALPSSGDSLVFKVGYVDITLGLSALAAIPLVNVTVFPTCGSSFGSASGGITLDVSGTLRYEGSGSYAYFGGATNPIVNALVLANGFRATGGEITNIIAGNVGGLVEVDGSCEFDTFETYGMNANIDYKSTAAVSVKVNYGSVYCDRTIGTWETFGPGSSLTTRKAAAVTTKGYAKGGSKFIHQSTGTITDLEINRGSLFDITGNEGGFTLTNSTRCAGAIWPDETSLITYTNPTVKRGY